MAKTKKSVRNQTAVPKGEALLMSGLTPPLLPTFGVFASQWVLEKQFGWQALHLRRVQSVLQHYLLPAFGDLVLDQITRERVIGYRFHLVSGKARAANDSGGDVLEIAPSTVNKIIGILRLILDEAANRFGIRNPCTSIRPLEVQRADADPFSLEQVQTILGRVRADYRPYLTVRFFTGARSGEVHALKWKHIDFRNRQVMIRESLHHARTEPVKSDGSLREIEMIGSVREALLAVLPTAYAEDPESFADRYVFCTHTGQPIDTENFNRHVWKPLLRDLGLKYRHPYEMRHTCAALWLAAGESPEWIARQLGFTTTDALLRMYRRFVPPAPRIDGVAADTLLSWGINNSVADAANDPFLVTDRKVGKVPRV